MEACKIIEQLIGEEPIPFSWWEKFPKLAQKTMERIIKKNDKLTADLKAYRESFGNQGLLQQKAEAKIKKLEIEIKQREYEITELIAGQRAKKEAGS